MKTGFGPEKQALFRRQAIFMYDSNPGTVLHCVYKYRVVPMTFTVNPIGVLPRTNPVWEDFIARTRSSGVRIKLPDGTLTEDDDGVSTRSRIFPLRSSRPDIQTGLHAITEALSPGKDEKMGDKEIVARL
ncbi:hypothetical protein C8R43DRAFT_1129378 [Mycena crocata]|nr:hypothetical protein C8R43DRAFT_1129378 [Mycena crocata]